MRTQAAEGAATDSTGAVDGTELDMGDAERFLVASKNIDSGIDYKVEVSPNGTDWYDHGTSQAGVTGAFDDNLHTAARYARVNITASGAAGETGDFHLAAKDDK